MLQNKSVTRIGFAFNSPLDVSVFIPDTYRITMDSKVEEEIHFSKEVVDTKCPMQIVFSSIKELEAHKITILDCTKEDIPCEIDGDKLLKSISSILGH